ncbi:MAG: reductive dehalogenase [Gammaproteobacteria bacterium]|jgi:reductive dehalogenase|nr:reductive dehalogenase [Gammaproteobacteria bacterium]|tara:strand:+ start:16616 stop:17854 length:1239 start_codon:yes stop_codon:yes gene_type:complete
MPKPSSLTKLYVKALSPDQPPYQVDERIYQRFDQRNNLTIGRPNWDESIQVFTRKSVDTRVKKIKTDRPGYQTEDYSLFLAGGVTTFRMGNSINHANRGVTSWDTLGNELPPGINRWDDLPEKATTMLKRAARYFGADMVGIAPLDRRWFFSHAFWADNTHKEVVFKAVDIPEETDDQLIIPEKMRWVIVMGVWMNPSVIQYTPSPLGCAETRLAYSREGLMVSGVAEFLRGIGYQAIPSINDLALNIPMAIDAGFGEQGRNGKLITPQFGPSMRLCKVITDLPLARDFPIRFGVAEFCKNCQKCAESCPVYAIPTGEPSWSRPNISNNPGVYTWHLDNELCRRYWSLGNGTNCTVCIRSCPFTKHPGLVHDLTRTFISNTPVFNPLIRKLDDLLGYGKEGDAERFWSGSDG